MPYGTVSEETVPFSKKIYFFGRQRGSRMEKNMLI
jgi:hypothetical protein